MLKKEDEIEGIWMGGGGKMHNIIPKFLILSFPWNQNCKLNCKVFNKTICSTSIAKLPIKYN